ncbi:MAG: ABC transporter ATP-binding protein [Bacteroidetes bacterium]|nr:ABC transporter ATP-binding protein [Bacteroidota bacterium]
MTSQDFIKLVDVRKEFREGSVRREVLKGVALSVKEGEFVVLVGRSGAGKSTLLNVICGIDSPSSGEVVIKGVPLSSMSERERTLFRRRHVGFVFQSFNLIPTLTVGENVLLPIRLDGMRDKQRETYALSLLDRVGLGDRIDSRPDVLSGGEQQRVTIARALATKPFLLLADEPTGNLDYETGRQVMDLLHDLARSTGTTMLVVTHDRDFIGTSDQVVTLRDGKLQLLSDTDA